MRNLNFVGGELCVVRMLPPSCDVTALKVQSAILTASVFIFILSEVEGGNFCKANLVSSD